jgi:hypothetical protein
MIHTQNKRVCLVFVYYGENNINASLTTVHSYMHDVDELVWSGSQSHTKEFVLCLCINRTCGYTVCLCALCPFFYISRCDCVCQKLGHVCIKIEMIENSVDGIASSVQACVYIKPIVSHNRKTLFHEHEKNLTKLAQILLPRAWLLFLDRFSSPPSFGSSSSLF